MFIVIVALVVALLSGFMSMSIKTTTGLAKIGQTVVVLALIVAAVALYFVFAAKPGDPNQRPPITPKPGQIDTKYDA